MSFLYPRYFPEGNGCVEETNSNPSEIITNGYKFYPVGMTLEKAMALIWKSKVFNISGSATGIAYCCGGDDAPARLNYSFYGQTTSTTNVDKMSERACVSFIFYDVSYSGIGIGCDGIPFTPSPIFPDAGFNLSVSTIYLYDNLCYLPVYYNFGIGHNYITGVYETFVGSFNLDGTLFPLYGGAPLECDDSSTSINITATTAVERKAE
jgi:hypothetical protein